jgi:drug/metabolite transporter (DMT)-like permease
MNRRKADAALVFNTLVWGSTFVLVKAALLYISPLVFLALRFSLAASSLLLFFALRGRLHWDRSTAQAGAFAGVFLFGGYVLQTIGLRTTSPAKSAFLTGLTSVMVPLVASLVYRNRPRYLEMVGVVVATAGLGLMTLEGPIGSVRQGDILTLCSAVSFAAYIVILGHFSERMSFELLSVAQAASAAILGLASFGWAEELHLKFQPIVVAAILITGILATAVPFTLQAWAQQYTTSTRTALIYMLEPVVALCTSLILTGEGLTGRAAAGAVLILGGIVLVEVKPSNSREHLLI